MILPRQKKGGKLIVTYYSDDDLDRIQGINRVEKPLKMGSGSVCGGEETKMKKDV